MSLELEGPGVDAASLCVRGGGAAGRGALRADAEAAEDETVAAVTPNPRPLGLEDLARTDRVQRVGRLPPTRGAQPGRALRAAPLRCLGFRPQLCVGQRYALVVVW